MPRLRDLRVTHEGWYWLLGAIVLCLTGLVRGINLLTLLGCLLLVTWCLHALSSWRQLKGLTGRRFVEGPVFAQTPFTLRAEVHNSRPSMHAGLVLREEGIPHGMVWHLASLHGGKTEHLHEDLCCTRRGRSSIGPLVATTSLPFGLITRRLLLAPREDFLVLPRLGRVHRGRLRRRLKHEAASAGRTRRPLRAHPAAQADLHGLRPFRSGDSPNWIHWRTTARKGALMVREMEEMSTDNLILIFDPSTGLTAEGFERALSLAATICWEWCRQTGDRMVLAVAGSPPVIVSGATGRTLAVRMLECLAVQTMAPASDPATLLESLANERLPSAPVLVVSTGPTSLQGPLSAGLRRPVVCVNLAEDQADEFFEMDS